MCVFMSGVCGVCTWYVSVGVFVVCVSGVCVCANNFWESVLSFSHVGLQGLNSDPQACQ